MGIGNDNINTVSLSFRRTRPTVSGRDLATGYLDDMLIFSFGLNQQGSHFIEVGVEEVLQGHEMCNEVIRYFKAESDIAAFANRL